MLFCRYLAHSMRIYMRWNFGNDEPWNIFSCTRVVLDNPQLAFSDVYSFQVQRVYWSSCLQGLPSGLLLKHLSEIVMILFYKIVPEYPLVYFKEDECGGWSRLDTKVLYIYKSC